VKFVAAPQIQPLTIPADIPFLYHRHQRHIPQHNHPQQLVRHVAAAGLLGKAQPPREKYHGCNDKDRGAIFLPRAGKGNVRDGGNHRQRQQNRSKRIDKGRKQALCHGFPLSIGEHVAAVFLPGALHLFGGQAGGGSAVPNQKHSFFLGGSPEKALINGVSPAPGPAAARNPYVLHNLLHGSVPPN